MRIYVYNEGSCPALRADELAQQLGRLTGLSVEVRGEFIRHWVVGRPEAERISANLPRLLAQARVVDPMRRLQPPREPMATELAAEKRVLDTPGKTSAGILYDGGVVQCLLAQLLPISALDDCHIVTTGRLVGTWVEDDHRWHAHTVLLGEPAIISTSGLVQAPVRPREYYRAQGLATTRLVPREIVEAGLQQQLADRMLLADDPRLTAAAVGCALQAIAFHVTGEAFCPVPTCRLYNARTQEGLIRSQCSAEARLCPKHERLFGELRNAANE